MRPANARISQKSFRSRRINMPRKEWRFVSLGVLLGALLVTSSRAAEGGINSWTSTNGPNGGPIGALAIDPVTPATLYAGTDSNGVFKSTNGGARWSAVNTGLTGKTVSILAVDPQTPPPPMRQDKEGGVVGNFRAPRGGGAVTPTPMAGWWTSPPAR